MTQEQIEQAAQQYADMHFVDEALIYSNEPWDKAKDIYAKTLADFAKLCMANQWIPVEERLPEDDRLVLAHFADVEKPLDYATAYYRNGVWNIPDDWYYDCKVDFWMEIPQFNPEKEER